MTKEDLQKIVEETGYDFRTAPCPAPKRVAPPADIEEAEVAEICKQRARNGSSPQAVLRRKIIAFKEANPKTSFVYFVQYNEAGPIKIGFATSPRQRLAELQVGCPYKLRVLAIIRGTRQTEADLLSRFGHHRMRGEWFEPYEGLLNHIARLSSVNIPGVDFVPNSKKFVPVL